MKIVITGASDGIGKSIAFSLAKKGHELYLLGRDAKKLEQVRSESVTLGAKSVEIFSVDLSKVEEIRSFNDELVAKNTVIDGLVNNAGIWQKKAQLDEIPDEEILNVVNTNLTGMILLTKTVLPLIRKSVNGFVINVSSRSGYSAQQGQSVYSASKYGVRGFTEVLREDLLGSGIRVAGIYQGGTNTQMFNKAGESFPADKLATFIPSEELANVITFLIERPKGIWLSEIRVESK